MCVFRLADGSFQTHDFRVDESNKTLTISEKWMTMGPVLFSVLYDVVGPNAHTDRKLCRFTAEMHHPYDAENIAIP